MEWEIKPEEYRYILGDFIRSGIHIKYNKHTINGKPSVIDMDGKNLTTYPNSKTRFYNGIPLGDADTLVGTVNALLWL